MLSHRGFTLAELLIVLGILAIIAIFSIPKILQASQDNKRIAIFKESVGTLASITKEMSDAGVLFSTATAQKDYFNSKINAVKICTTDPNAEGCWNGDVSGNVGNANAYRLHNGACLTSFNGAGIAENRETILIDYNCELGPNTSSVDILALTLCHNTGGCDTGYMPILGSGPNGKGTVGPNVASSVTLYEAIFND